MPVGMCVSRMALEVLLTCCPPGPLARIACSSRSSSRISISISSETSGETSTAAKLVCRLPSALNGLMRTRRWMPLSPLR